mgnify:CR=1 FL=1
MLKPVSRYLKLLRINLLYSSGQTTALTVRKWITHKELTINILELSPLQVKISAITDYC